MRFSVIAMDLRQALLREYHSVWVVRAFSEVMDPGSWEGWHRHIAVFDDDVVVLGEVRMGPGKLDVAPVEDIGSMWG
jgi:hypothetical protein